MILLTRLNGTEVGVNADLIEKVEPTPDTVITLVDGTKYVVAESTEQVVARIVEFRARVLAYAEQLAIATDVPPLPTQVAQATAVAAGGGRERRSALRLVIEPDADFDTENGRD